MFKVHFHQKKICDENIYSTAEKFPLHEIVSFPHIFKGLWDASIPFDNRRMNLGGHSYGVTEWIDLGIIHFHSRCYEIEIENCLRVILSHGYIDTDDSDEERKKKLVKLAECSIDDICNTCTVDLITAPIPSFHKVAIYLGHLDCPEKAMKAYYPDATAVPNDAFVTTIQELEKKYAF